MYNARRQRLQLIVDGVIEAEIAAQINLRQLERARKVGPVFSPVLKGRIDEFRIYAQTFDAATKPVRVSPPYPAAPTQIPRGSARCSPVERDEPPP